VEENEMVDQGAHLRSHDGVGLGWWCLVFAFLVSVLSFSRLYTYEYRKQFSTQRKTTHEQKDTP
jgi:hypothetical protein